jgi:hypothetical protein
LNQTPGESGNGDDAMSTEATKSQGVEPTEDAAAAKIAQGLKEPPAADPLPKEFNEQIKGMTLVDMQKIVDAAVERAVVAATTKLTPSARDKYIAAKMADVPPEFHAALGNDPAKFAEQEQVVRERFKSVLAAIGVKAAAVGGISSAGAPVHQFGVAMSSAQKIAAGLSEARRAQTQR